MLDHADISQPAVCTKVPSAASPPIDPPPSPPAECASQACAAERYEQANQVSANQYHHPAGDTPREYFGYESDGEATAATQLPWGKLARMELCAKAQIEDLVPILSRLSQAEVENLLAEAGRMVGACDYLGVIRAVRLGIVLLALKRMTRHGEFMRRARELTPTISHSIRQNAMTLAKAWGERRLRVPMLTAGSIVEAVKVAKQKVPAAAAQPVAPKRSGLLSTGHAVLMSGSSMERERAAAALQTCAEWVRASQSADGAGARAGSRVRQLARYLGSDEPTLLLELAGKLHASIEKIGSPGGRTVPG